MQSFQTQIQLLDYTKIPFKEIPDLNTIYLYLKKIEKDELEDMTEAISLLHFLKDVIINSYSIPIIFEQDDTVLNRNLQLMRLLIEGMYEKKELIELQQDYQKLARLSIPKDRKSQIDFYARWLLIAQTGKQQEAYEQLLKSMMNNRWSYKKDQKKLNKIKKNCIDYQQALLFEELAREIGHTKIKSK